MVTERQKITELSRRPGVATGALLAAAGIDVESEALNWAEIELKYSGYLARERAAAAKLSELHDFPLPSNLNYSHLLSLSFEAREKLQRLQPASLGDAGRIPGVSPSDLQALVFEVLRLPAVDSPVVGEPVSRETELN
jgi:tRNA uridine 5-carboxymethylaminomethyl modification enzyme